MSQLNLFLEYIYVCYEDFRETSVQYVYYSILSFFFKEKFFYACYKVSIRKLLVCDKKHLLVYQYSNYFF